MFFIHTVPNNKYTEQFSHIGESLTNKNIPAETKVAEWISADAGAGASIESGSHKCSPICADFTDAAISRRMDTVTGYESSNCPISNFVSISSLKATLIVDISTERNRL